MAVMTKLEEMYSTSRARCVEDFEFFANCVLSARIDSKLCEKIQKQVESGVEVDCVNSSYAVALNAWLCAINRGPRLNVAPTETFAWLFGDKINKPLSVRA